MVRDHLTYQQSANRGANMAGNQRQSESRERQKESRGTEKYGSGPGSSGAGNVRVHSNTPENRTGEMNPSAPTDATEGPSTNLASDQADGGTRHGASRGEPARGATKSNDGTTKKPSTGKHEAA